MTHRIPLCSAFHDGGSRCERSEKAVPLKAQSCFAMQNGTESRDATQARTPRLSLQIRQRPRSQNGPAIYRAPRQQTTDRELQAGHAREHGSGQYENREERLSARLGPECAIESTGIPWPI